MARLERSTGVKADATRSERYWKDTALFAIWATTVLDAIDMAVATLQTLRTVDGISTSWLITTPSRTSGNIWMFSGLTRPPGIRVPGIEFIEFELTNRAVDGESLPDAKDPGSDSQTAG